MGARLRIDQLPPHLQKQAMAQLEREQPKAAIAAPAEPAGQRLKQKSDDGLNKTERRFLGLLRTTEDPARIKPHGITLLLANGVRYTPDFFVAGPELRAYEVKGPHAWDDAIVKLKVAASVHTWLKFVLVSPTGHGAWRMQEMVP